MIGIYSENCTKHIRAMPWPRPIVASLSPGRRPRFIPSPVHVEFLVYIVNSDRVFSQYVGYSLSALFLNYCTNIHLSPVLYV
jgi:hypothetical protein